MMARQISRVPLASRKGASRAPRPLVPAAVLAALAGRSCARRSRREYFTNTSIAGPIYGRSPFHRCNQMITSAPEPGANITDKSRCTIEDSSGKSQGTGMAHAASLLSRRARRCPAYQRANVNSIFGEPVRTSPALDRFAALINQAIDDGA